MKYYNAEVFITARQNARALLVPAEFHAWPALIGSMAPASASLSNCIPRLVPWPAQACCWPSQELAGFAPSLCIFTTKSSISCSVHWLTYLSLQILQNHDIYCPHQDTFKSEEDSILILCWDNRFKSANLHLVTPSNSHGTSLSIKQNYNSD